MKYHTEQYFSLVTHTESVHPIAGQGRAQQRHNGPDRRRER